MHACVPDLINVKYWFSVRLSFRKGLNLVILGGFLLFSGRNISGLYLSLRKLK